MRYVTLIFVLALFAAFPAAARSGRTEVVPGERRVWPYDAEIPGCQDHGILAKIATRFAERESKFWNSPLQISGYENIRRIAWRPWGLDYIPRRYCTATALVSDGRRRRIDYSVREDLGIIGASWGVEWCMLGLDRNAAYAPAC